MGIPKLVKELRSTRPSPEQSNTPPGCGQDLTVAEIMEFNNNFYVAVKETTTGLGAFELLVDPYSGAVIPEIGPNKKWNARYCHTPASASGADMRNGPVCTLTGSYPENAAPELGDSPSSGVDLSFSHARDGIETHDS